MRKHDEAMTSLGAQNPTWVLVCKRRFTMNGVLYNTGCLIDVVAFSAARNWSFLLQNRYAVFEPPSDRARPKATPLPPPAPPAPKLAPVQIVADSDPIRSLGLTYLQRLKANNNDAGKTRDEIERDCGSLFTSACRVLGVRRNEFFRRRVDDIWLIAARLAEAA